MNKKSKNGLRGLVIISVLLFSTYLVLRYVLSPTESINPVKEMDDLTKTEENYGAEIAKHARTYRLPVSYLKALVVLECSGNKPAEPRFEQHIFDALKKVRDGEKKHWGSITTKTIRDASDDALRNLATSWGPFQLMGYQCIEMGLNVKDIRGDESVYWGIVWINKRYGKRLRKGDYKNAFHIHNTGRPYPRFGSPLTHDPNYVDRGLSYIAYFEKKS